MDSEQPLSEPKLPKIENFFNIFKEYKRAQHIWQLLKCKTLGDYSDIYLTADVLLLADIFENFRNVCLTTYSLDPAHYLTSPGLSWDAMLKKTGVELKLLTDVNMLHFSLKV